MTWAAFALLLLFVFICHVFPLTDSDIWWHLSAGRWMAENLVIPRLDPFCTSSLGKPWLDAQWGFQILAYSLWKIGGSGALVLGKSALAAVTIALLLFRGWNRKTMPILLAITVYAAFHGRYLADVRPIWVTLALLAVQYRIFRDALDGKHPLLWAAMLFSQVLMAQVQGLHWLGPVQAALLAVGHFGWNWKTPQAHKTGWMIGMLCFSGILNPFGWQGWIFPFKLLNRIIPYGDNIFSREISENIPYWRWMAENPSAAHPFLILAALTAGLWFLLRPRSAKGEGWILLGYGLLGLMAQRNIPLFLFGSLIYFARVIPEAVNKSASPLQTFRALMIFCWALTFAQTGFFVWELRSAHQWEIPGSWETPFRFPQGAVNYLRTHALQGTMFNEMRHGGYLGWKLGPDQPPFLDGRMVLHDGIFLKEFLDVFDHPETFQAYQRKHGITWVVLPLTEGERYRSLAAHLAQSGLMTSVFCDGAEVLLTAPETWEGLEKPALWTLSQGDSAAHSRFGKNPRLLEKAVQNLKVWNSFQKVH